MVYVMKEGFLRVINQSGTARLAAFPVDSWADCMQDLLFRITSRLLVRRRRALRMPMFADSP